MRTIAVVHQLSDWPLSVPGLEVVTAREYLVDPTWTLERRVRVFNLCRTYTYQSEGYYVSLLAEGRGHRPFPDLRAVLDMKSRWRVRQIDEELDALVQKSLADLHGDRFTLSIYFGTNLARRHERLAQRLFAQFPAPLQRAHFVRDHDDDRRWHMTSIAPIALRDVPASHLDQVAEAAAAHAGRRRRDSRTHGSGRYDLAILVDPNEELAPSDARALARFRRAGRNVGFDVQMIERGDYARLAEFDALLIRETTAVDHHTFRFAQRAESLGIVVIDDPQSILRCTNKVYQAEALRLHDVPTPRTLIVDRVDVDAIVDAVGLPCVLKSPDGSFSRGVVKCKTAEEVALKAADMLADSDLVLAQEYLPTEFDWRIGVLGGQALYACRYLMATGHWQIVKPGRGGYRYGKVEPVPLAEAPEDVVATAVRAAGVIGAGLYGVDVKVAGGRPYVIEVNDNPNLDAGCEDRELGDELYRRILQNLLTRVRSRKAASAQNPS